MKFTSETRGQYLAGKFFLLGLQSPQSRRYLNHERNRRNFELALDYLEGFEGKDIVGFLPQVNQFLGELNDLASGERPFFKHLHHPPDDLLHAVIEGRAIVAKALTEQRALRRT